MTDAWLEKRRRAHSSENTHRKAGSRNNKNCVLLFEKLFTLGEVGVKIRRTGLVPKVFYCYCFDMDDALGGGDSGILRY